MMNSLIKRMICPLLVLAIGTLTGCAKQSDPIGTMHNNDQMIIDRISYIRDSKDPESYEPDEYLGTVKDSENQEYKVYSVKNDENGYLLSENSNEKLLFRKEFNTMATQIYTVDLKESSMDYFRFGNENGKKLIILPGLSLKSVMGSADAVVGAYASMAEDYDVYLFERIRSFPEGYTMDDMADDTLKAIEELGLSDVNIMGVSLGGMIGLKMALKSPQTIHSLVLCSAASRIPEESSGAILKWRQYAVNKDIPALSKAFGEAVYTPEFFEMYQEIILHANDDATDADLKRFVQAIDAITGCDVYEQLNEIKCPVFVIGAGEDRVLGVKTSLEMIEKLGCEGYIYAGRGHGVYDEAPDYLQRVKGFLDPVQ